MGLARSWSWSLLSPVASLSFQLVIALLPALPPDGDPHPHHAQPPPRASPAPSPSSKSPAWGHITVPPADGKQTWRRDASTSQSWLPALPTRGGGGLVSWGHGNKALHTGAYPADPCLHPGG